MKHFLSKKTKIVLSSIVRDWKEDFGTKASRLWFFGTILHLVSGFSVHAQIQIDQNLTPEEYVNNVLLGEGVEAFNVTYTGGVSQLGYLSQGENSFSISSGVVLSTEPSENLECSFNECNDCLGNTFSDPDLLDIANSVPSLIGQSFNVISVNDGCVLEFDFVSSGDSISFNYVFGSDEYEFWIKFSMILLA